MFLFQLFVAQIMGDSWDSSYLESQVDKRTTKKQQIPRLIFLGGIMSSLCRLPGKNRVFWLCFGLKCHFLGLDRIGGKQEVHMVGPRTQEVNPFPGMSPSLLFWPYCVCGCVLLLKTYIRLVSKGINVTAECILSCFQGGRKRKCTQL